MTTLPYSAARAKSADAVRIPVGLRSAKFWINAFIVWHLVAIVFWSLPFQPAIKTAVNAVTHPYMLFLGVWQAWDMFSPDPIQIRTRVDATVCFRDGSRTTWTFPEMSKLGLIERFQKERYRKWGQDSVRINANWRIWEPTARFIARKYHDPKNPVVRVELKRHWSRVNRTEPPAVAASLATWKHYTFYRMAVHPGDL